MNSITSVKTGTMTARRRLTAGEAACRLVDAVEQRHSALRHREQATDGVRQFLGVVGVVHEDRWTIGERDDRDVVAGRHSRHEVRSQCFEERDVVAGGGAVVDEDRHVDRLGRARHARTSRLTPSSLI